MRRHLHALVVTGLIGAVLSVAHASALQPPAQLWVLEHSGGTLAQSPASPALALSEEFTAEAWIYVVRPVYGPIFGTFADKNGSLVPAFRLLLGDFSGVVSDPVPLTLSQAPSSLESWVEFTTPPAVPLRRWTHVAATLGGGTLSVYVDGELAGSAPSPGPPPAGSRRWGFGCTVAPDGSAQGGSVAAALRQVRLWSRALTAAEVAASATALPAPGAPGLLAAWPLDDGPGQVLRDTGPSGLHGHLGTDTVVEDADPRWIRTTVLEAGPFFEWDDPLVALPGCGSVTNPCAGRAALFDHGDDGDLDLFVFRGHAPEFPAAEQTVLLNDGSGHFTADQAVAFDGAAPRMRGGGLLIAEDFDGDGHRDLFLNDAGPDHSAAPGGQNRLLIQQQDGRLRDVTATHLPIKSAFNHGICAGDFDVDGDVDLVSAPIYSLGIDHLRLTRLDLNDGTGRFTMGRGRLPWERGPAWDPEDPRGEGRACAVLDANRDGSPDILLGQDGRSALLLINDGTGSFTIAAPGSIPSNPVAPNGIAFNFRIADLDGDGISDVAGMQFDDRESNETPFLWRGRGDGTFADVSERLPDTWIRRPVGWVTNIAVPDIDGNGWPDVVLHTLGAGTSMHLYLNLGGGRLVDASEFLPFSGSRGPQGDIGDIDSDGDLDILLLNGDRLEVLRQVKRPDPSLLVEALRPARRRLARQP